MAALIASKAAAKTLVLYEEGKPVPDGAALSVESAEGLCGYSWNPETLVFPARMSANDASPVVVSIESPGQESCAYETVHPDDEHVELKEISLSPSRTNVVFVFKGEPWSQSGACTDELRNGSGRQLHNKGEAKLVVRSDGKVSENCGGKKITHKFGFVVRASGGKVLEARYL